MSYLQNVDISLQDLVKNIDYGNYVIPKFQRDFVWNISDIESLGDSIVRGYPISSLLTMSVNGSLKISASAIKTDGANKIGENPSYVLDGQQRITSIAKIFLGFDEQKEYYFDLLSMLYEKFPEDNIELDKGIKNKLDLSRNNNFSPLSDNLCRGFNIGITGDEKYTRQYNRFISGKAIIENRFGSVIPKFLKLLEEKDETTIDKYIDYLSAVLGTMSSYGIPATQIAANSDLGLVIRVFEKVNSTGRKLTLFDLINAKTFETKNYPYEKGLSDFLNENIKRYIEDNKKNPQIFNEFLEYNKNNCSYKNLARIVRTISIAETVTSPQKFVMTQTYMLSKNSDFWFEKWDASGRHILDFYSWIKEEGLVKLGNKTFYEYIAAIFVIYPKIINNKYFLDVVKKYSLYMTLTYKGFNKSDSDLFYKFLEFAKYLNEAIDFEKYKYTNLPSMVINLNEDDILEIRSSKKSYDAILYIIYHEKANGKGLVDLLGNKVEFPKVVGIDDHHIAPKSFFNNNKKYESIANKMLLDSDSNRFDIRNRFIFEYIDELKNHHNKNFEYILEQNLIQGLLTKSIKNYDELIAYRAKKISEIVNKYFD